MSDLGTNILVRRFQHHMLDKLFPAPAEHGMPYRKYTRYFVADQMSSSKNDKDILLFLHSVIEELKASKQNSYNAVVLFKGPDIQTEDEFEYFLGERLCALVELDSWRFSKGAGITGEYPCSDYRLNLKEEDLYVTGLHGLSTKKTRRFPFPAVVFSAANEPGKKEVRMHPIQHHISLPYPVTA